MVDAYIAMQKLLLAQPSIAAITERIFVGELPDDLIVSEMPIECLLIAALGGVETRGFSPVMRYRAEFWSFAKSYYESSVLDATVFEYVRHIDRIAFEGVLIHGLISAGGPFMVRDGRTGWPALWRSVAIVADYRRIGG